LVIGVMSGSVARKSIRTSKRFAPEVRSESRRREPWVLRPRAHHDLGFIKIRTAGPSMTIQTAKPHNIV
jgi:hypothetical protein